MIDEKIVIKKLEDRKADFIRKHPELKNGISVETINEFIHMLELEAKYQNSRKE